MTRDTSGLSSLVSFAYYDRESSSLRTSQATFDLGFTPSLPTLPTWGWMSGGELYERPMSELRISEPDSSSSLPTPTTSDAQGSTPNRREKQGHGAYLNDIQHLLPSPQSSEQGSSSLLPTPNASDGPKGGPNRRDGAGNPYLSGIQALLPTPGANDSTGGETAEAREARDAGGPALRDLGALLPTPTACDHKGAGLNPQRYADRSQLAGIEKLLPTPIAGDALGARNRTSSRPEGSRHHDGTTLTDAIWLTEGRTTDTLGNLLPTPMANQENPGAGGELRAAITHGPERRNETGIDSWGRPNRGRTGEFTQPPSNDGNTPSGDQPHVQLTIEAD